MELIRIYDRAFSEVGAVGSFTYLKYTSHFRGEGSAEAVFPMGVGTELFVPDGYIEVPDGGIYRILSVERDSREGILRVKCGGLLSLFEGTAIPEEYGMQGDVLVLLGALVRKGAGNLPMGLTLEAAEGGRSVTFRSGRSELYGDLVSLCYLGDAGMSLTVKDGGLVFAPQIPRDRRMGTADPVTVDRRMGTIRSETVTWDLSAYKNVAVVSGAEKDDGGRYTAVVRGEDVDFGDSFPDGDYFDRQMLVTFSAPLSGYAAESADGESVFDEEAYTAAMVSAGAAALGRCRPKLYLYGTIEGSDIRPGDLVTVSDPDYGITAEALCEQVVTEWDGNRKAVRAELRGSGDYR